MTLDQIAARVRQDQLEVLGAFHTTGEDNLGDGTVVLLGPSEDGFWPNFRASPEYNDGDDDPLDRWSERVICKASAELGAEPRFPFGTPHYPFLSWAIRSGRAWPSPVHLLVHDTAGLWVSYRGALILPERLDLPPHANNPCDTCDDKPCLTACPVGALTSQAYDLPACHSYLDTFPGRACMETGCAVRKACPQSQKHHRIEAQSAFHMDAFHT
ncbi:MAG: ferredoxin [Boseongicola sp.]|nr:ferredoxin [Boseongicola sp.]NNL18485.1 ferredoxin [Boseongicola sp.]